MKKILWAISSIAALSFALYAQTTAFTYQGKLSFNGTAVNGNYDLQFTLFNVDASGVPVAPGLTNTGVSVAGGVFTTMIDFGSGIFSGTNYWLEIGVRTNGSTGAFTTLVPRQPITPAPYAINSATAATAEMAANVTGNISDSQLSANIARLNGNQTFTGYLTLANASNTFAGSFTGNGSGLTNIAANAISSGTTSNVALNFALSPTSGATNGLDAAQPTYATYWGVQGAWQSFVATRNGYLTELRLGLANWSEDIVGNWSLFAGEGGGTLLANGSFVLPLDFSGDYSFTSATPPYLTAGNTYTIAIDTTALSMGVALATNNPYAQGRSSLGASNDLCFKTYIDTPGIYGAIDIQANGVRALRLEGNTNTTSPNIIGGHASNAVVLGVWGATIAGGGNSTAPNLISGNFSSIGGGFSNRISGAGATVGGGASNAVAKTGTYATIAGGLANKVTDAGGVVGGGNGNTASYCAAVPGGMSNYAGGYFSFAAGRRARTFHGGTFVWADQTDADFTSSGNNQFIIRAGGGVGINKTNPVAGALDVNGPVYATAFAGNLIGSATSFSGSLSGDVTGTQSATVVSSVGGQSAANVASGASAANAANTANVGNTIVKRDGSGNFSAGTITATTFSGNHSGSGSALTNVWKLGGNSGTAPGFDFIGTTDNQALEVKVNGTRALRIEPNNSSPNFIHGYSGNQVATNIYAATISGGGYLNSAQSVLASLATIGGGAGNLVQTGAFYATISGGSGNKIDTNAVRATIGGGYNNSIAADALSAVIAGGSLGTIGTNAYGAVIAGGNDNAIGASSSNSVISGGIGHRIGTNSSTCFIGGGNYNVIGNDAPYATVCGGNGCIIQRAPYATVGGGSANLVRNDSAYSTIGGGYWNNIQTNAVTSTIAGGSFNFVGANSYGSSIGGGDFNSISSDSTESCIAGGYDNWIGANCSYATIVGGTANNIQTGGSSSTISGGLNNVIQSNALRSVIAGGYGNTALPNTSYATVPGGFNNAAASYAFAAGNSARATNAGAFVWSDSTGSIGSTNNDSVTMRASGGYRLFSSGAAGVYLAPGSGTWASLSDRNMKEDFQEVDSRDILDKVAELPIATWKYKSQEAGKRHIGPVAQDFAAAFGVGENDTTITTVDADGVALAAIKGLNEKLKEKDSEIRELKDRLAEVEKMLKSVSK